MKIHTIEDFDENIDLVSLWNEEEKKATGVDNFEDNWSIGNNIMKCFFFFFV